MATFVPLINLPAQFQDSVTSLNMSGGSLEFFLAGTSTATNLFSNNTGTSIGSSITLNSGGYPESGGNVITLFRDSSISLKIVGKNAVGTTIFTADDLEDALVILSSVANAKGASLVGVEDSGAYFTGAQVEAVLADVGQNYLKASRNHAVTGVYTFGSPGAIAMADQQIRRPEFKDYAITHSVVSSSTGTLILDLSTGNSFSVTLTENVTTLTISNPPATGKFGQFTLEVTQDGAGGAYTLAQPASVIAPGGTNPVISTGNDAVDDLTYRTRNAGTTWKIDFSQAYA